MCRRLCLQHVVRRVWVRRRLLCQRLLRLHLHLWLRLHLHLWLYQHPCLRLVGLAVSAAAGLCWVAVCLVWGQRAAAVRCQWGLVACLRPAALRGLLCRLGVP